MATQQPIHSMQRGTVEAAIWEKTSEKGRYYRVTFRRHYPTSGGKNATAENFGPRDLAALAVLAIQVEAWICDTQNAAGGPADAVEDVRHA